MLVALFFSSKSIMDRAVNDLKVLICVDKSEEVTIKCK